MFKEIVLPNYWKKLFALILKEIFITGNYPISATNEGRSRIISSPLSITCNNTKMTMSTADNKPVYIPKTLIGQPTSNTTTTHFSLTPVSQQIPFEDIPSPPPATTSTNYPFTLCAVTPSSIKSIPLSQVSNLYYIQSLKRIILYLNINCLIQFKQNLWC